MKGRVVDNGEDPRTQFWAGKSEDGGIGVACPYELRRSS